MNFRIKGALLGFSLAIATPVFADETAPEAGKAEAAAHDDWVADFDKAVEKAKAEKKDLLVDFTGSDWCIWCKRLHGEVFAHEAFLTAAKKEYVLVSLDYPHDEALIAKVPNMSRNKELAAKYGINSFPTVLLMTPEGEVFGKTGYEKGGPESYVESLTKLRAEGMPELKTSKELAASIASAKDDATRATLADTAIQAFSSLEPNSPLRLTRVGPVRAAFAADAGNKQGVAAKAAIALMQAKAADQSILDTASGFDPKNEQGFLEQVVDARSSLVRSLEDVKPYVKAIDDLFALGELKDKKLAAKLATAATFMNFQHLKDLDKAKVWAKKVQDLGIDENDKRTKMLVDKVLAATEAPK